MTLGNIGGPNSIFRNSTYNIFKDKENIHAMLSAGADVRVDESNIEEYLKNGQLTEKGKAAITNGIGKMDLHQPSNIVQKFAMSDKRLQEKIKDCNNDPECIHNANLDYEKSNENYLKWTKSEGKLIENDLRVGGRLVFDPETGEVMSPEDIDELQNAKSFEVKVSGYLGGYNILPLLANSEKNEILKNAGNLGYEPIAATILYKDDEGKVTESKSVYITQSSDKLKSNKAQRFLVGNKLYHRAKISGGKTVDVSEEEISSLMLNRGGEFINPNEIIEPNHYANHITGISSNPDLPISNSLIVHSNNIKGIAIGEEDLDDVMKKTAILGSMGYGNEDITLKKVSGSMYTLSREGANDLTVMFAPKSNDKIKSAINDWIESEPTTSKSSTLSEKTSSEEISSETSTMNPTKEDLFMDAEEAKNDSKSTDYSTESTTAPNTRSSFSFDEADDITSVPTVSNPDTLVTNRPGIVERPIEKKWNDDEMVSVNPKSGIPTNKTFKSKIVAPLANRLAAYMPDTSLLVTETNDSKHSNTEQSRYNRSVDVDFNHNNYSNEDIKSTIEEARKYGLDLEFESGNKELIEELDDTYPELAHNFLYIPGLKDHFSVYMSEINKIKKPYKNY